MVLVDETKLQEFIGKVVNEWGAAEVTLNTSAGERLGLFKAMAGAGELTPEELAEKTGTHPRMIKEWLAGQAAGGFVTYNRIDGTCTLPEEHAYALTDENSPAYAAGFYQSLVSLFKDEEKIIESFRTGKGLGWGDHHQHLFEGTERFYVSLLFAAIRDRRICIRFRIILCDYLINDSFIDIEPQSIKGCSRIG